MNLVNKKASFQFTNILNRLSINVQNFDLSRCDERTFYITIAVQHVNHSTTCDLIFLIDRDELFGAISLNNLYENVQNFFVKHFNYSLLYIDEMQIAQRASENKKFTECMRTYMQKYPKYEAKLS
ncbi:hypothetical protein DCE79_15510 [Lysinibacillus sp. 2017]|uniref:hypothetical protein n=1 Tax=unclassified Lysinibacillus TaxID=2636778 RepID=UPI000D529FEE|nr:MULTISPECIES: hypothetical protein [unclassified Lysinibacillus]AWE08693.1 hypothetical protein DCE79_15510 [Lysinibacillus sp. 2017]TGN35114.1 hypothetical protein E4L99_11560 [Lysinibacillus sp. S2017]